MVGRCDDYQRGRFFRRKRREFVRNSRIEVNAIPRIQNLFSPADQNLNLPGENEKDFLTFVVAHDPSTIWLSAGPQDERTHRPIWIVTCDQRKVRGGISSLTTGSTHN